MYIAFMLNLSDKTSEYFFVSMSLFFKTGRNNESWCDVILLVDEYNWIHDYKIKWKKLSLTKFTTESHFNNNINSFKFQFRKKILESIGLKNIPNPHPRIRKTYVTLSSEQVEKVNLLFNNEWKGQSFSNIDYVITGSNAAGQGNPSKSSFYLKSTNNQKFNIGFLFQSLRLAINKNMLFYDEFETIWKKYFNNQPIFQQLKFDDWLKHDHWLYENFRFFNRNLTEKQQQLKIKEIKKRYCPQRKNIENVYNLIWKYRQNLHNQLNKNKKQFTEKFWGKQFDDNFIKLIEFAHIKSVREIKAECISNKFNTNILNEIKDKDNILPLNSDTHILFDRHEICWNLNGNLFSKNNTNTEKMIPIDFKCIPEQTLLRIHKYLSWYMKKYL